MTKTDTLKMSAIIGLAVCILCILAGRKHSDSDSTSSDSAPQDMIHAVTEENETAIATSITAGHVQTETEPETAAEPEHANQNLTGTITMAGSTSMERFANALAESFMSKYPGVTVTVEFTGSSAGIESVLAGSVDIGNSSRNLQEEEEFSGAVENLVAIEGIAVITDTSNQVSDLSTEQLIGIFMGEIRKWSEVGGGDEPVVVVGREAGSGTRETFEELLGIKDLCAYANELNSTGLVMARVIATPGAIGYVSTDVLNDTVRALSIDGTDPVEENIKSGCYPLSGPMIMVTNGEISVQSEAVREMFAYLKSEEGQELIRTVDLIVPD